MSEKVKAQKQAYLDYLGICEHEGCGILLNMENMPGDSVGASWFCPECRNRLSHRSFGYEVAGKDNDGRDKWKKVRWVGKVNDNPGWVTKKPESNYQVGILKVIIRSPGPGLL